MSMRRTKCQKTSYMAWHPKAQVWSSESELVEVLRATQKFPDVFHSHQWTWFSFLNGGKRAGFSQLFLPLLFPVPRYWFRYHIYCTYWLKRRAIWRCRECRTTDHVIASIGRPSTLGLSSAIMFQLYEDTRRVCYKRSNCRLVLQKEALGKQAGFLDYYI